MVPRRVELCRWKQSFHPGAYWWIQDTQRYPISPEAGHRGRAETQSETKKIRTPGRRLTAVKNKESGEYPSEGGRPVRPRRRLSEGSFLEDGDGAHHGAVVGDIRGGRTGHGPCLKEMGRTPPGRQPIGLLITNG